jgi:hypothetical protein
MNPALLDLNRIKTLPIPRFADFPISSAAGLQNPIKKAARLIIPLGKTH